MHSSVGRGRAAVEARAPQNPTGLYTLCAAEACAGFALYVLGSLLVLFLTEAGGQEQATALRWVGTFGAVCFMMPLLGGVAADRWLGLRWAVLIGAALLAAGFAMLALAPALPWLGLVLLLCGGGLFRSNIVAMVGRLYRPGDSGSISGYRLFYAAFNLGAVMAPPLAGALARTERWSVAFLLGGGSMMLALFVLAVGHHKLARAEQHADDECELADEHQRPSSDVSRWLAICVVAQVSLLWTISFGQSDGSLLLWARDHTRRSWLLGFEVPASAFASIPPLLVLLLTPMSAVMGRANIARSSLAKILAGLGCTSLGFMLMLGVAGNGNLPTSPGWLLGCFAFLTAGELIVAPVTQSLIAQLAPPRSAGLSSALWYGATAVGFWLAGQLGSLGQSYSPSTLFGLLAAIPLMAGLLLIAQRGYLRAALS